MKTVSLPQRNLMLTDCLSYPQATLPNSCFLCNPCFNLAELHCSSKPFTYVFKQSKYKKTTIFILDALRPRITYDSVSHTNLKKPI